MLRPKASIEASDPHPSEKVASMSVVTKPARISRLAERPGNTKPTSRLPHNPSPLLVRQKRCRRQAKDRVRFLSVMGLEPTTFGSEVQCAIRCATWNAILGSMAIIQYLFTIFDGLIVEAGRTVVRVVKRAGRETSKWMSMSMVCHISAVLESLVRVSHLA